MNVRNRLTRLESQLAKMNPIAALTDEYLNARLLAVVNDFPDVWREFIAGAATVENAPAWSPGLDLAQLSDAEFGAMVIAALG